MKAPARRRRSASRRRVARGLRAGTRERIDAVHLGLHMTSGECEAFAQARNDEIQRTRPERKGAQSRRSVGLRHADADPGTSDPLRLAGARRARHRPDRHRQDRRLHPAHAVDARARPRARPHAPNSHSGADARARRPGRGGVRQIRRQPQAEPRPPDRRRLVRRPGGQDRARRRRGDRDSRTPARFHRARRPALERHRDSRHRRGRPHARHGLHSRHRAYLQARSLHPPNAVLLGDDAAGNHPPRRHVSPQSGARRGLPRRHHRREHHTGACALGRNARREALDAEAHHPGRRQFQERAHLL